MTSHTSITILGAITKTGSFILENLAALDINILLIAAGDEEHAQINRLLTSVKPRARTMVQQCAREGCWEGDIILIATHPSNLSGIDHIKDVVTQKTVVVFHDDETIQSLLPHSRIVKATVKEGGFSLESHHEEALSDVEDLFQSAGFGLDKVFTH